MIKNILFTYLISLALLTTVKADLSDFIEIEEKEIVSKAEVEKLGDPNCDNAQEVVDKANILANMYSQMLEPFYSAKRDDEKAAINNLRQWGGIEIEGESNKLKRLRNVAMVIKAECVFDDGDYQAALSYNNKALDIIDSKNSKLWKRAYDLMQKIIDLQ